MTRLRGACLMLMLAAAGALSVACLVPVGLRP